MTRPIALLATLAAAAAVLLAGCRTTPRREPPAASCTTALRAAANTAVTEIARREHRPAGSLRGTVRPVTVWIDDPDTSVDVGCANGHWIVTEVVPIGPQ